ncbi:MAG: D-glycerate dehydrogenase [Desulfomonile tiedjei]|nr:D-glycerate dehydrogenase [Desulfomonile tiedjei]
MKALVTGKLLEPILARVRVEHEIVVNEAERPMEREALLDQIGDKEGLLCMISDRIDAELMDRAPRLRMIANYGVGYDHIDVPAATSRGIMVSNTPGVLTDTTADLTLALILAVARRVVEGDATTRSGRFRQWTPFHFLGTDVTGKTLGIIGLGQIGTEVARRARAFRMPILYHNRRPVSAELERELNATFADMETVLSQSDFVSLHVSLNEQSRGMIGRAELALMKPTAFLINVSRGPVVDELALVEALRNETIAGAGLDVYEREPALTPGLAEFKNCCLLPHVGSATIEARTRMGTLAVDNLLVGLADRIPPNCLNCTDLGRDKA